MDTRPDSTNTLETLEYGGHDRRGLRGDDLAVRVGRLAPVLLVTVTAACGDAIESQRTPYLDRAVETGRWLQSVAVAGTGGRIPNEVGVTASFSADLGTGAAGRSLFFLELYQATGDESFLRSAEREVESALAQLDASFDAELQFGLYNGIAGVGFAAAELFRATGAPQFHQAAQDVMRRLHDGAQEGDAGSVSWGEVDDVLAGSAGIGLALLYLAHAFDDTVSLELARQTGAGLLDRVHERDGGLWWSRAAGGDVNLPNFSHGTAGVGFFLSSLHRATGDTVFLDAAERAADYLKSVADRSAGLFLVPYGVPNDGYVSAYDIGWAHGPAGTANIFVQLGEITGEQEYGELVGASARTLAASGMPGSSADPSRWTGPFRVDRRFGTSGAAVFLLRLTRNQPESPHRGLAQRIVDDIIDRGQRDAQGLHWSLPRYGFQEDDGTDATFTGFFYGAAGLGLTLLEMHYAVAGGAPFVRWPDDPFSGVSSIP